MIAASRQNRGVQGAQPPALLDTREYLDTHVEKSGPEPTYAKLSRWHPDAISFRDEARRPIAKAYALLGRDLRAVDVLSCGRATVAFSPDGRLLRSKRTGVPTAIVQKCSAAGCPSCVADAVRRNLRTIDERLRELDRRAWSEGPLYMRPARLVLVANGLGKVDARLRGVEAIESRGFARQTNARHAAECRCRKCADPALVAEGLVRVGEPLYDDGEHPGVAFRPLLALKRVQRDLFLARAGDQKRQRPGRFVLVDRLRARHPVVKIVRGRRQRRPPVFQDAVGVESFDYGGGGPEFPTTVRDVYGQETPGAFLHFRVRRGVIRYVRRKSFTERRRRAEQFRIGPPPSFDAYGARFATLDQPARPDEPLDAALDRFIDALDRLQRAAVWSAHVDAAVIRIEYTLSTPAERKRRSADKRAAGDIAGADELMSRPYGTWWHVHAHMVLWGRFWPQSPGCLGPCPEACRCCRAFGVDNEDSLLMCWRRALIQTGRYKAELAAAGINEARVRRELRRLAHPAHRCWSRVLVGEGVKIGGARIETPRRTSADGRRLTIADIMREVVKYATKPVKLAALPVERIAEVLEATRHRRLLRCTGLLYGLHLVENEVSGTATANLEGADALGDHGMKTAVDDKGTSYESSAWRWRSDEQARGLRHEALFDVDEKHRAAWKAKRRILARPQVAA